MNKSGPQGVSGKNLKIKKMKSTGGAQTVTATEDVEVGEMDNRLDKRDKIISMILVGVIIGVVVLLIEYNFFAGQ